MSRTDGEVRRVARQRLGIDRLRPEQEDAIAALVGGRDVLCVLPTGAGKSAVYQVAGLVLPGRTLVVSPLLALQDDQRSTLDDAGASTGAVSSVVTTAHAAAALRDTEDEAFTFLTPEQLRRPEVVEQLAGVDLVAVDEAHCIATWGERFRPDYLLLGAAVENLGRPPVLALTATAAPHVRAEIVERLGLHDPLLVVSGFERPEIHLAVRAVHDERELDDATADAVGTIEGTVLVYVARRRDAERLAGRLEGSRGRPAAAYHAGLGVRRRRAVHERFADPSPAIVVATTAFGMGIDVPHVRGVVHVEPPESLEAYAQEVGRAGRDGAAAQAVCVHVLGRASRRAFSGGSAAVGARKVLEAHARIVSGVDSLEEVARDRTMGPTRAAQAVALLSDLGAVALDGGLVATRPLDDHDRIEVARRCRALRAVQASRGPMVARYLTGEGCRWQALLAYFGEVLPRPCGHCDRCDEGRSVEAGGQVGRRVTHRSFGAGVVVEHEGDALTVIFDDHGYKVLSAEAVADEGLLRDDTPVGDAPARRRPVPSPTGGS